MTLANCLPEVLGEQEQRVTPWTNMLATRKRIPMSIHSAICKYLHSM